MVSTPPALSGSDELRETVDLLAKVLASISDRLDSQGQQINELLQLSTRTSTARPEPQDHTLADSRNSFIRKMVFRLRWSACPTMSALVRLVPQRWRL